MDIKTAIVLGAVVSITTFAAVQKTDFSTDAVSRVLQSFRSVANMDSTVVSTLSASGDVSISALPVDIQEGNLYSAQIPSALIGSGKNLIVEFSGATKLEISGKLAKGDQTNLMTKFDSGNGIVIFDSSAWSSSQQTSNYSNEISMVKNGDMASLLSFATAELAKVGYAGSYVVFDMGSAKFINSFKSTFDVSGKAASPSVVAISFDDGTVYTFKYNDTISEQEFKFPIKKTRYMRMDFLSDTTGSFSGGTSTSGNYGISRNLILSDVIKTIVPVDQSFSSTQTGMVSRFTIPALQTITGFAYANVFFSKAVTPPGIDDIPNLQMLPSKNSFDYYVGTVWAQTGTGAWVQTPGVNGFDTAYIRLCAGPAQCLQDLSVPLN